jgi:hypothetical protein
MTRAELEHAIRAACEVSGDDEVYVFGSQAILGQYPDAPESLRQSAEADIAPVTAIDTVDVIDGNLGELSPFHEAFGFYVHGVSIDAAILPIGWEKRAILLWICSIIPAKSAAASGDQRIFITSREFAPWRRTSS